MQCSTYVRVREEDMSQGAIVHDRLPDTNCRAWLVVSEKKLDMLQDRYAWQVMEVGDEPWIDASGKKRGTPPFTGAVGKVYIETLRYYHVPAVAT